MIRAIQHERILYQVAFEYLTTEFEFEDEEIEEALNFGQLTYNKLVLEAIFEDA